MKRTLTGIAAASIVLGTMAPAAFASTSSITWGKKNIQFQKYTANGVYGYAEDGTTYMPIWYVLQALKNSGYDYTFDGKVLNIKTPSGITPNTNGIDLGTGNLTIQLNGKDVKKVYTEARKDPAGGKNAVFTTYIPIYYIQQILDAVNFHNTWDGTNWKGQQLSSITASAANSSVSVGQGDQVTVVLKDSDGNTVTPSKVTYSVTDANGNDTDGASITAHGVFMASQPGTYIVTANADGIVASTKITVYGQAAAVQISAPSTLVANKVSTATVTATVVDANGNPVNNFNGSATLHFDTTNGAFKFVPSTDTSPKYDDGTVNTSDQTIKFTNGVATFKVVAGQTPGVTDKIELQNLTDSNGVAVSGYQSASVSITTVAQVPTAISVKPEANYVETNDGSGKVNFDVNVVDQDGQPMLGGTYILTGTITGGGKFDSDGATSGETIVVSGGKATTVTVDAPKGVNGTYALTVTGANLTTGSASVTAATAQNAAKLVATVDPSSSASFVEGKGNTVVDLSTTDANGVPTGDTSGMSTLVVYLTDSKGNAFTDPTIAAYQADGTTLAGTVSKTSDGGYALPTGTVKLKITDTSGNPNAGTYNLVVKDTAKSGALAVSQPLSITETADSTVAKIGLTSVTNILSGSGSTVSTTVTAQLEDANGNPISGNADPITFSAQAVTSNIGSAAFNNGAFSATPSVTVKADGTGKATVTFTAQNYGGDAWTVKATDGTASGTIEEDVVSHPAASYAFKLQDASSSSLTYATAGDTIKVVKSDGSAPLSLVNAALDSNGKAAVAGNDNVTLTVSHASGIQGFPTTSGTVNGGKVKVSVNTANDTITFTGALKDVSAYIDGTSAENLVMKAGKAGTVVFTLTDNSTGATGSASIQVSAGTAVAAVAIPTFTNATTVSDAAPTQFTVQLVDAGGNPVVATTDTQVNLGTTGWAAGHAPTFQDANHLTVTSVTIKAGQSSTVAYLVPTGDDSGTITASVTVGGKTYTGTSQTITVAKTN